MKHLFTLIAFMALTQTAYAQKAVHVVGLLGFSAEAEYDEVKVDGRSVQDGESEDLEDNFGLQVTIDTAVSKQLRVGVRLAGMTAKGEATDATYLTADGGLWLRLTFPTGGVIPFIGAGAGVTWLSIESEEREVLGEVTLDGVGWHVMGGFGVEIPSDGVSFTAGLYFSRQNVEPEGDANEVKITLADGLLSRTLLAAGLAF